MQLNDRNIFLLDGIGALLSAASTGLLLPLFSAYIGLEAKFLQWIGFLGATLALYSLTCFFLAKKTKPFMLGAIVVFNSLYIAFALGLVLFEDSLFPLGRAYFGAEVVIILSVVCLEVWIYRRHFGSKHFHN